MRSSYGGVGADDTQAQAGHLPFYEVPDVAGTLGGGAQLRGWSDDLDRSGAFPVMHAPDLAATLTASSNPNSNLAGRSKSDDENLVYIEDCQGEGDECYVHGDACFVPTHEVSPCLQERGYKGADSDMTQAYVFAENQRGEVRFTEGNIASQLVTKGGKPGQGYPAILDERGAYSVHNGDNTCFAEGVAQCVTGSKGMPGAVSDVGFVRRLTPLECERLQGFPDDWTDILSDSRRYKALGNAVAVPCPTWIAERINVFELSGADA